MPFNACFPSIAPNFRKLGEGPAKNMDAPSAILSTKRGLRMKRAPPVSLCRFLVTRRLVFLLLTRFLVFHFAMVFNTSMAFQGSIPDTEGEQNAIIH